MLRCFAELTPNNNSLIEIGAGGSEYLPYLHHKFGFEVTGLDYSEVGCESARELLKSMNVPGVVYQADMFDPPTLVLEKFDVVVSFGLVEHFTDTAQAIAACAAFAKPGGMVLTLIPNMTGLYGFLYKLFDRNIFDIHVPISLNELINAHHAAGLKIVQSECLLGLPGVIDGDRIDPVWIRHALRRVVFRFSKIYWWLEERGIGIPENTFSSPYLICVARKAI